MRHTALIALLFLVLSPSQNANAQSDYGNLADERMMACSSVFLGAPADIGTLAACSLGYVRGYMCEHARENLPMNLSWKQIAACFRNPKDGAKDKSQRNSER